MTAVASGINEPSGFLNQDVFALNGSHHRLKGVYVDTRAGLTFSRVVKGVPETVLTQSYGVAARKLGIRLDDLALPTAYPKQVEAGNLDSEWDGLFVSHVQGPGYLADPAQNPNGKAFCLIWGPNANRRGLGTLPGDAPVMWGCTTSGIMFASLMPWQALRHRLVPQIFAELDKEERTVSGRPLQASDVFIVMGPGARVGFMLDNVAYKFMASGGERFVRNLPFVDGARRNGRGSLAPWDLKLSDLAYDELVETQINGETIPRRQVVFNPLCTLTDPNSHSKRIMDKRSGTDTFYTNPTASCFFGGAMIIDEDHQAGYFQE